MITVFYLLIILMAMILTTVLIYVIKVSKQQKKKINEWRQRDNSISLRDYEWDGFKNKYTK